MIAPVTATCPQPFCCIILHTAGCAISAKSRRAAVLKGNQFILVRDILPFCIHSVFHRHDNMSFLLVVFSRLIGFKDIQPPFSPSLGIQVEVTSHRCATRVQSTKHEFASSHNQGIPDLHIVLCRPTKLVSPKHSISEHGYLPRCPLVSEVFSKSKYFDSTWLLSRGTRNKHLSEGIEGSNAYFLHRPRIPKRTCFVEG